MSDRIESLVELLTEYKRVLSDLLELSYEKRKVIIESMTDRLSEIVQTELRALSQIKTLEKQRTELIEAISEANGVAPSELTLSIIADGAPKKQEQELRALHRELSAIASSQMEINAANKALLDAQLEHSEVMLNLMIDSTDPLNNLYTLDGTTEGEKKITSGYIDRQT